MLPTEDLISTVILLYIRTHLLVAVSRIQVQLTIASYYSLFIYGVLLLDYYLRSLVFFCSRGLNFIST